MGFSDWSIDVSLITDKRLGSCLGLVLMVAVTSHLLVIHSLTKYVASDCKQHHELRPGFNFK